MAKRVGKPIAVGVVGLGRAGWGMHCKELAARPDKYALVAASEPVSCERRVAFTERFVGATAYASFEELLADERVELVSIASRTQDHEPQAIAALRAGKHVVLDKPMAGDLRSARRIARTAERSSGHLFVRHNRRYETAFTAIRSIINSRVLGRVHTVRLRRHNFQHRADWQTLKSEAGGQLLNWGPHLIDHGLVLLGSPVASIWSDLRKINARGDAEDHVHLILTGEKNVVCDIEISGAVARGSAEWAIHGDRGSVTCSGDTLRLKHLAPAFRPTRRRASTGMVDGFGGGKLDWVERELNATVDEHGDPSDIWDAVHATVRRRRKYPITVEHAVEVMRVVEAAKKGTEFA